MWLAEAPLYNGGYSAQTGARRWAQAGAPHTQPAPGRHAPTPALAPLAPSAPAHPHAGHFTQCVWKATTAVGCGMARCGAATLVVCRYSPAGNVLGQFAANV